MKVSVFVYILSMITIGTACQSTTMPKGQKTQSAATEQNDPVLVRELVSAERFKSLMSEREDFYLIDVRTPEEFAEGHIDGAVNINFFDDDFDDQLQKLDKTKPVFVYCRSGNRSGKTAKKMQALEFHEVFDLDGGMKAWSVEEE